MATNLRATFRATRDNLRNAIPDDMTVEATLCQIIRKTGSHEHVTDALRGLVPDYDKKLAESTSKFEAACRKYADLTTIKKNAFLQLSDEDLARLKILVSQRLYDGPACRRLAFGDIQHKASLDLYSAMVSAHTSDGMTMYCVPALIMIDRLDLLHYDDC